MRILLLLEFVLIEFQHFGYIYNSYVYNSLISVLICLFYLVSI